MNYKNLAKTDKQIFELTSLELKRQQETLMMIPSENYTSESVLEALGTPFTNKYAEGEPGKRYYQGNEVIDELEKLTVRRTLNLFGLKSKEWHVNVKAVSASYANFAVITALLEPGQKILAMNLPDGGHLSHGWDLSDGRKVTFSSKVFNIKRYRVERKTGKFDYAKIEKQALSFKPDLIISGGTAYPREISYIRMARIAKKVGAYYLADVAHEAGLIAGGANKSPWPHADVVTMSTQKTLRGPRGSIIVCKKALRRAPSNTARLDSAKRAGRQDKINLASKIDRAIFPGLQGGPFMNNIASMAVALKEAKSSKFREYALQTVKNAKVLAHELMKYGFKVSSDGTDKHLVLVDLRNRKMKGGEVAEALEEAGIVVNKNTVPYETGSPFDPSGIRLGTPALTTRGMKESEIKMIASWISEVISETRKIKSVLGDVKRLVKQYPIYANLGR